jgi:hypothetical protein
MSGREDGDVTEPRARYVVPVAAADRVARQQARVDETAVDVQLS